MDNSISRAKISPPLLRRNFEFRPRLAEAMARTLDSCRLMVLSAPAGSGKTVALTQMLTCLPERTAVAWITAWEDDDLVHLLKCLTLALEPYDLPWRMSPEAMPLAAVGDRAGLTRVVAALSHAMGQSGLEGGRIIFDDTHLLADRRVYEFLELLIQALPAHWIVVTSGRVDPPMPLARLRLRGELLEWNQKHLWFRPEEVEVLLSRQQNVDAAQVRDLVTSTNGWPAGIAAQLIGTSGTPQSPQGESRMRRRRMFDFLRQEVIEQLPPPLQTFLERCSVLEELTESRCVQVTGDALAARWLDEIDRRSLFVTVLDTGEFTLRLHALFRDFLRERLNTYRAAEVPGLLERAAESEPSVSRRVAYLLGMKAHERAAVALRESVVALRREIGDEQIMRLITQFPAPLQVNSPDLQLVRGLIALGRFRWTVAADLLQRAMDGFIGAQRAQEALEARALTCLALLNHQFTAAERMWREAPVPTESTVALVVDVLLRIQISLRSGPAEDTPDWLQQLAIVVRNMEPEHWLLATLTRHVKACVGRPGTRPAVSAVIEALEDHLRASGSSNLSLQLYSVRSWLALWRGDAEEALEFATRRDDELRWLGRLLPDGRPDRDLENARIIAIATYLLGRYDEAMAVLLDSGSVEEYTRFASLKLNLAQFAAAEHDWTTLRTLLSECDAITVHATAPTLDSMRRCLGAELALGEADVNGAVAILDDALRATVSGDMRRANGRLRVTLARAQWRRGSQASAVAALEPLLRHAADTGEVLSLMLCGRRALSELAEAPWSTLEPPLLGVLRQCSERVEALQKAHGFPVHAGAAAGSHDQLLSDREMQVIALLAEGESNKVIARVLNLSPHTVKRHVARILDKTGQDSRGQAAAWLSRHPELLSRGPSFAGLGARRKPV